jgi:hypothetical protein
MSPVSLFWLALKGEPCWDAPPILDNLPNSAEEVFERLTVFAFGERRQPTSCLLPEGAPIVRTSRVRPQHVANLAHISCKDDAAATTPPADLVAALTLLNPYANYRATLLRASDIR